MTEWKQVKLADISIDGKGSYGIPASAVPYSEGRYTYLRITDINDDGTLDLSDRKSLSDPDAGKYLLQPNDIVFARTGNSTGRNYFYNPDDGELVYAGFLIKFSIDPQKVNPLFVKYYMQSSLYKAWVQSFNTGSTRGNINAQTFANMTINLPPREQQDLLVKTLLPLDKKIRVNNQINRNLEEQAQAIYQEFFDGKDMRSTIKHGKLKDICFYVKERISVSDLTVDNYYSTENLLTDKRGAVRASSLPQTTMTTKCVYGNILVSNIRPYFKKILFCDRAGGCSTDVLCFQAKQPQYTAFLYSTLFFDSFFNYMTVGAKGTKMPRGDKDQIMDYPIPIPDLQSLEEFNQLAMPLLKLVQKHKQENTILAQTRDTLLPKLMSGEINAYEENAL